MDLRIDSGRAASPSQQLTEGVLDALAGGRLEAGDRLPSVRALAAQVLVNPNTVAKAYRELEAMGVVAGRSGAGVFVAPGGPGLARGRRRDETLKEVSRAIRTALRAGHDPERILQRVEKTLAALARKGSA